MPNRSVSYDDYSADVPGIIFTETQSNDRTAARGGSVDVTVSANFASSSLRTEEDFPAEPAQVTAESEPLHIKKGRRGIRLGSAAALSIAVPFFFLILGLLAVRSLRVPAGLKPQEESLGQEEQQSQLQQQGQKHESGGRELGEVLLQQVDELLQLQSVAANLAEAVETRESHRSLMKLWKSVEMARGMQQLLVRSPGPSECTALREVLNRGVDALSELYELSRQRGLQLVRETRAVQPTNDFSNQELKTMETYLGSNLVEALENHMASLRYSCFAFKQKLEQTEVSLEGLPDFLGLEDWRLLDAVAANLKFLRAAHQAAKVGLQSAEELRSDVVTVTLSHIVREQTRMHRDCRDLLDERRALYRAVKERQRALSDENTAAVQELETVEDLLSRAEQLLQLHRGEIEELQSEREIVPGEAARQQAERVGKELLAVLDAAFARLQCSREIRSDHNVESTYRVLASRASQEATESSRRVSDIETEVHSRVASHGSLSRMKHLEEQGETQERTLMNVSIMKLLTESFEHIVENAESASRQARNAADSTSEGSEAAMPPWALMASARRAAVTADTLVGNAELLWLHSKLLGSVECDLRVSSSLAHAGAAVVTEGTAPTGPTAEGRQPWVVELPSQQKAQVETLKGKVQTLKGVARSQWSARDLAFTAGNMKNAAVGISLIVQHQVLEQVTDLIP
ncbi:hypothetical protein, conserved [Eimeria acervulina]|uniref:Uncharacterized protein n=1 Tax=Eimeria acervulina TaxID=5801 RepID=U6GHY6_EIMAC|nr:hypothetical protein, conserved [Eimeria acervulina]CDI79876.1 hypothetical protein, conserved [Eimeria acervulina]